MVCEEWKGEVCDQGFGSPLAEGSEWVGIGDGGQLALRCGSTVGCEGGGAGESFAIPTGASTVPVGFGEFAGRPCCASFLSPSECIVGVCQSS